MTSEDMLKAAAEVGDISPLYTVILQDNPHILEKIDLIPFIETPLHVAVSAGHVHFATEIMTLKPSFAEKLNPQGLTPIHLAIELGHITIALCLVHINKDLVRVKGREGLTPLHLASQKGEITLLTEFLKACPDSIKDVTVRNETALHIALRHEQYAALQVLFRWLVTNSQIGAIHLERTILNWKDEQGNTILHVAAVNNNTEAVKLLLKSWMILDSKNLEGQTTLDIASSEDIKMVLVKAGSRIKVITKIRWLITSTSEWIMCKSGMRELVSEEARNAYLIVSTLVATATYQAALSPPGGLYQTDGDTNNTLSHVAFNSSVNDGKSIMSNKHFMVFSTMNTSAFMVSTTTIIALLPARNVVWIPVSLSIMLLQLTYTNDVLQISPTSLTTEVINWIFLAPVLMLIAGISSGSIHRG
ncbi:Ankyrin repeat-containing protein BDA1, partial [Mucuna pruriens]